MLVSMGSEPEVSPLKRRSPKARFRVLGRKEGYVDRVVQAIEGEIFGGRLTSGTKLPPEREFSERLGVSRTVVREAVRILVTKGLLETRHGIGTTVRSVTQEQVIKPLNLFIRTSGGSVDIEHLHQVRSILEVGNAGLAVEQATADDIESLGRAVAAMEAAAEDPREFAAQDAEFHRCLAQATHNPLLVLLLDSIRDLMAEVRTLVAQQHKLFERVMPSHIRIFECLASRNAAGARKAMSEHVDIALSIQRELLQGRKSRL
jgi:DNA-binding FadR family transcriptional regulator